MHIPDTVDRKALIELLNKNWMTHDGMWFLHCFMEYGIEKANQINKSAIQSLALMEIPRVKKALGMKDVEVDTFETFKQFVQGAFELGIPDFMNARMSFPERNVLHWEFKDNECFAYKGMKRIGAIDKYECGVIYRVMCWIDTLGISYSINPEPKKCLMLVDGKCSGDFMLKLK
ncbi:MAG: hypothetical protein JW920_10015 [Deltaproteobacteria bacterium]|nr:hypothetical protein [Deltaproteobacteria bacterium]